MSLGTPAPFGSVRSGTTDPSRGCEPNSYRQTLKERTLGLPLGFRQGWECRCELRPGTVAGNTNLKARLTMCLRVASSICAVRGRGVIRPRASRGMSHQLCRNQQLTLARLPPQAIRLLLSSRLVRLHRATRLVGRRSRDHLFLASVARDRHS